ncbi:BA75_01184T0 [Komagataella pastoris]|uniref:BA75_01184T0 n=1 Tax=Komagataella pastoris TaxID=4922 RepID=A0A1B2J7H2_PICPA|nr:BA75_01184T0 [Komagataella pastoris]
MDSPTDNIENSDTLTDFLNVFRASRNGVVYGGRLRFAHALALALVFKRKQPIGDTIYKASKLSFEHAWILAAFAIVYKGVLFAVKHVILKHNKASRKKYIHFIAGAIAGLLVYGQPTGGKLFSRNITHQVTLYCSSRMILAIGKMIAVKLSQSRSSYPNATPKVHQQSKRMIENISWYIYSMLSWGCCMYLYQSDPIFLHPSLRNSLEFMYNNERWKGLKGFFTQ